MSKKKHDRLADVLATIGRTAKGALFLDKLLYWWPKATTVHDDKVWIYRFGREKWADEIGVPLRNFEWLVTQFRSDGLIETHAYQVVNKKGKLWGPKVQHVRPTDHLLHIIKERTGRTMEGPEVPAGGSADGGSPTAQPPPTLQALPATSCGDSPQHVAYLLNKDTTYPSYKSKNQVEIKQGAPLTGDALGPSDEGKVLGEDSTKEKDPPTPQALDIAKPTNKKFAAALIPVWQSVMEEVDPGAYHGAFSAAKKGMLGDFVKACPKGYAGNVLTSVLTDWDGFVTTAKHDAAAFKPPAKPALPFLLKFVDVAVNFWMEKAGLVSMADGLQPKPQVAPKHTMASQTVKAVLTPAFVDMVYDPPAAGWDLLGKEEWNASPAWEKAMWEKVHVKELLAYNADYTAKTGKQPPLIDAMPAHEPAEGGQLIADDAAQD